jgi:hypothetical protein
VGGGIGPVKTPTILPRSLSPSASRRRGTAPSAGAAPGCPSGPGAQESSALAVDSTRPPQRRCRSPLGLGPIGLPDSEWGWGGGGTQEEAWAARVGKPAGNVPGIVHVGERRETEFPSGIGQVQADRSDRCAAAQVLRLLGQRGLPPGGGARAIARRGVGSCMLRAPCLRVMPLETLGGEFRDPDRAGRPHSLAGMPSRCQVHCRLHGWIRPCAAESRAARVVPAPPLDVLATCQRPYMVLGSCIG